MLPLPRRTAFVAALAGALWTVKVAIITARDGSFDPLEGVAFIGGLLMIVAASALIGLHLGRGLRPFARVAVTVTTVVGLVAVTVALEALGKAVIGGPYDGGNVGIEEEAGILLAGLAWLALGVSQLGRTGTAHRAGAFA